MVAWVMLRMPSGKYKNITADMIETVSINAMGEKTVFFKENGELKYGYEVEVKNGN